MNKVAFAYRPGQFKNKKALAFIRASRFNRRGGRIAFSDPVMGCHKEVKSLRCALSLFISPLL